MIWVCRSIGPAEWNNVQDRYENPFVKLGCPSQIMLVVASVSGSAMLFAGLPNASLLNAVAGFERVDDGKLPSEASLLVCHHVAFVKRFTYPKRKPLG